MPEDRNFPQGENKDGGYRFQEFEAGELVLFVGWDPDEIMNELDEWFVPGETMLRIVGKKDFGPDSYDVEEVTTGHSTFLWSTEMAKLWPPD